MPLEQFTDTSAPSAIQEMKRRLSRLETEEGRLRGLSFQPKEGDIFVVTTPKSGTTLVCQILHSLRSKGDMSFDEINLVIPCLEMAWDYGYRDLDAPQPGAPPRIFKTHAWQHHCPWHPAAKYIYVSRNPIDAAVSFYNFFNGWFFKPGEIDVNSFVRHFMLKRGAPSEKMQNASHWHNLASWYPKRNDPNVLFLFYEDIIQDYRLSVECIANFVGLAMGDEKLRDLAACQASIEHMQQYPQKYDEHMLKLARNEICGLERSAGLNDSGSAGKVFKGGHGKGEKELALSVQEEMKKKWADVVVPVTGYKTYDELRHSINKELGRIWK